MKIQRKRNSENSAVPANVRVHMPFRLLLSVAAADTGQPPPEATIVISRNGQRVPYPPPLTDLPTGVTAWTEQRLPTAAAWNMSAVPSVRRGGL